MITYVRQKKQLHNMKQGHGIGTECIGDIMCGPLFLNWCHAIFHILNKISQSMVTEETTRSALLRHVI